MAGAYRTGSEIIRCASKNARVTGRADLMIAGPKLMFGTKCPSITSRCKKSAPPPNTSSISLPNLEKSADKIDASICGPVALNGSVVIRYPKKGNADATTETRRRAQQIDSRRRHEATKEVQTEIPYFVISSVCPLWLMIFCLPSCLRAFVVNRVQGQLPDFQRASVSPCLRG